MFYQRLWHQKDYPLIFDAKGSLQKPRKKHLGALLMIQTGLHCDCDIYCRPHRVLALVLFFRKELLKHPGAQEISDSRGNLWAVRWDAIIRESSRPQKRFYRYLREILVNPHTSYIHVNYIY